MIRARNRRAVSSRSLTRAARIVSPSSAIPIFSTTSSARTFLTTTKRNTRPTIPSLSWSATSTPAKMKSELVTADELTKAVKQFTAATLSSRKTMSGQAADLGGSWIAASDLNFSKRYLDAVKRITPADLQRVARTYLTEPNRTLYALLPTGTKPKSELVASAQQTNAIQKFELANGLRLLVKEDHRLPFVEIRTVLRGGVLAENPTNNGVTLLMAKML